MNYISIFFLSLLSITAWSQSSSDIFSAIRSGQSTAVIELMDESIELCFDDNIDFMSKPQANKALNHFFTKNPPKSFIKKHKGNSPGADSKYLIGEYISTYGKTFRVYIFTKKYGTQELIQELRFDKN